MAASSPIALSSRRSRRRPLPPPPPPRRLPLSLLSSPHSIDPSSRALSFTLHHGHSSSASPCARRPCCASLGESAERGPSVERRLVSTSCNARFRMRSQPADELRAPSCSSPVESRIALRERRRAESARRAGSCTTKWRALARSLALARRAQVELLAVESREGRLLGKSHSALRSAQKGEKLLKVALAPGVALCEEGRAAIRVAAPDL